MAVSSVPPFQTYRARIGVPRAYGGYCRVCPEGLDLAQTLDLYNGALMRLPDRSRFERLAKAYPNLREDAQLGRRTGCGTCEAGCSQRLPIAPRPCRTSDPLSHWYPNPVGACHSKEGNSAPGFSPAYAAGDHFPGPDYTPVTPPATPAETEGAPEGDIGTLSTVPSYDDDLDDGYLGRWNGLPAQVFSPDGDGVKDTVTFTWDEPYQGRPEIPPDPGDPSATPPVPPTEGQPAIPPGAETSLWVMKPIRYGGDSEQHWCVMPEARVGPGEVSFTWDGQVGGWTLYDDWYYWYTRRTDPRPARSRTRSWDGSSSTPP